MILSAFDSLGFFKSCGLIAAICFFAASYCCAEAAEALPSKLVFVTSLEVPKSENSKAPHIVRRIKPTLTGIFLFSNGLISHWNSSTFKTWKRPVKKLLSYSLDDKGLVRSVSVMANSTSRINMLLENGDFEADAVSINRPLAGYSTAGNNSAFAYGNECVILAGLNTYSIRGSGHIALSPNKFMRLRHSLLELWTLKPFLLHRQIKVPDEGMFIEFSLDEKWILVCGTKSSTLIETASGTILRHAKKEFAVPGCGATFFEHSGRDLVAMLSGREIVIIDPARGSFERCTLPEERTIGCIGRTSKSGELVVFSHLKPIELYRAREAR